MEKNISKAWNRIDAFTEIVLGECRSKGEFSEADVQMRVREMVDQNDMNEIYLAKRVVSYIILDLLRCKIITSAGAGWYKFVKN